MKMIRIGFEPRTFAAAAALMLCATNAHALSLTFDTPVTTSPTQAAGVWYTDRYAPAGFTSPVLFAGDNRLQQTISAADSADLRPGGFSDGFYNTQGRKYDLDPGTTSMSIDLYIPTSFTTSGLRGAGFWGTAFDATNVISAYPIIEFTSNTDTDGSGARFRGWDVTTGGWINMGLPTGFAPNQFYTLNIQLIGTDFVYSVGNASLTQDAAGSTYIGNTILQGHNTQTGVSYDIYWDNLNTPTAAPVPLPATLPLLLGGIAGLGAMRRRRSAAAAAAAEGAAA
jgi:hypothetical protein